MTLAQPVQGQMWTDVEFESTELPAGQRVINPSSARIVALETAALKVALAGAPDEAASRQGAPGTMVTLPSPDGADLRFELILSPIMAPALAKASPDIRTFILKGLDDPSAWGRGDLTPRGFHAMVWGASGLFLVDPLVNGDSTIHQSYYARDHRRRETTSGWICLSAPEPNRPSGVKDAALKERAHVKLTNGADLRTYRIAIAATGEYTDYHGGTVDLASEAIAVALNRVNAIYERELAIRFELVNANRDIIYTDPDSDPFTNNDPNLLLDESQATIDSVIGVGEYDIGHVLSTASVGRAAIGVVCNNFVKAKGESGSSTPDNDIFFIDTLTHEIGHQLSATHTSNGTTAGCAGLRNATTAYEPGSGSTIMAIPIVDCGVETLQSRVDEYFHVASLDQIVDFVTSGFGNQCGSVTATGNTPPTADAGNDYVIPTNTPFVLTGAGGDLDGDTLTYAWEQFDLGDPSPPMTDDGFRPIFRSWTPPVPPNPTRTFPRLTDLLAGTLAVGELFPTTDRQLTFRLTVRDNRAGGGAFGTDTAVLAVTTSAGPFAVTAPNTAVTWNRSGPHTITWDVAGTDGPPVSCPSVNITLSSDGGATFPVALATGTSNDGAEDVFVFVPNTTTARVRIDCADNIFFDISDTDFTIVDSGELIFLDDFESSDVGEWSSAYP